jgi:hypothetical protein
MIEAFNESYKYLVVDKKRGSYRTYWAKVKKEQKYLDDLIDLLLAYLSNGAKPLFDHGRSHLVVSGLIMMNSRGVFMGEHLVYLAGFEVIDKEFLLTKVRNAIFSETNPNQVKGKTLDLFIALNIALNFNEFARSLKHIKDLAGGKLIPIHDRRYAKVYKEEDFSSSILLSPEKEYNAPDVIVFDGMLNFYITMTTLIDHNLFCQVNSSKVKKQRNAAGNKSVEIRLELPFSKIGDEWNSWKSENPTSNLFVMNLNSCEALCGPGFVNSYTQLVKTAITKKLCDAKAKISRKALKTCLNMVEIKYEEESRNDEMRRQLNQVLNDKNALKMLVNKLWERNVTKFE